MKETKLKETFLNIKTDEDMDNKIMHQLLHYDTTATNKLIQEKMRYIIKLATIISFILIGSTTVFIAAQHINPYSSMHFMTAKELEERRQMDGDNSLSLIPENSFSKKFGKSKKEKIIDEITDEEGTIINYLYREIDVPGDPYEAGTKAFAMINLPNLTPTLLLENYTLNSEGYSYAMRDFSGHMYESVEALFSILGDPVHKYSEYRPTIRSVYMTYYLYSEERRPNSSKSIFEVKEQEKDSIKVTEYTTKGGFFCNIIEFSPDYTVVTIDIENKEVGYGSYTFSFNHFTTEEIQEVLDSIPITADTEHVLP